MKKVELLAPAGDLEKLKMAIIYGADAVYLGGEAFGMRKASKNFTLDQIREGVLFAHDRGKKVYVTLNIVPHDKDMEGIEEYAKELEEAGVDAFIVSDPGMFTVIKRTTPNMEIHISTQASVTNYETIMFWHGLGVRRIVLARELSLEEITNITRRLPDDMDIECFVHGAMCMSYSGRCLISNYMTGRDANMGDCAQPCRYKYHVVEEKRPGQYFPIEEHEEGTFLFNSKDLCMLEHLPEVIEAGIHSLKIEGRVKSSYYVATVIRSYRMALDAYLKDPENYKYDPAWLTEIQKVSHRDFTTGFFFKKPGTEDHVYGTSSYLRCYDFVGMVLDYDKESGIATVEQRNRMFVGEEIEVFGPGKDYFVQTIGEMWDEENVPIDVAPHPQQILRLKTMQPVERFDLIRKPRED
ncbi:peptidase U32 family protein [Gudongella oleilytica]|uniref:peptidase U32 family protein n=1 Tax=Gudongella oleilytica TaxID=1582259 RepID=UPI000FF8A24D|nr:U32 family peptidase [Gudongella oleilytica]